MRARSMTTIRSLAWFNVLAILAILACSVGCPSKELTRDKTLRATLIATNTARDGFMAFDDVHQDAIIDRATSLEAGQRDLMQYQHDVQGRVLRAFEAVYKAIAAAAVLKDDASLGHVLQAAKLLQEAIEAAKATVKGTP